MVQLTPGRNFAETLREAKLDAITTAQKDAEERRKVVPKVFTQLYKSGQAMECVPLPSWLRIIVDVEHSKHIVELVSAADRTAADVVACWNKFDEEYAVAKVRLPLPLLPTNSLKSHAPQHTLARLDKQLETAKRKKGEVLLSARQSVEELRERSALPPEKLALLTRSRRRMTEAKHQAQMDALDAELDEMQEDRIAQVRRSSLTQATGADQVPTADPVQGRHVARRQGQWRRREDERAAGEEGEEALSPGSWSQQRAGDVGRGTWRLAMDFERAGRYRLL